MFGPIAARSASRSPYGISLKPGVNGPKPARYWSSDEKPTIVVVRPWKLSSQTMISAWSSGDAAHLIAPLPNHLDRGLDGLGAGVHRQRRVEAGSLAELAQEGAHLVVVERPRREREAVQLLLRRRHDRRVPVSLVHRRVRAQHVQVALSVHVPDPHALAALEHDGQRVVVVGRVALGFFEVAVGQRSRGRRHRRHGLSLLSAKKIHD